MPNVLQFPVKQRRVLVPMEILDRVGAYHDVRNQMHTVKCFRELITEMDPKYEHTARVLWSEANKKLDQMIAEYISVFGPLPAEG